MPDIETLLRDELRRLADSVDPAKLRPLRAPARRGRWLAIRGRWLMAAGAFTAAAAAVAAALVMSAHLPGGRTAGMTATGGMPRYYLTVTGGKTRLVATVRDSATGQADGRLTLPPPGRHAYDFWQVSAAADDRHFAIATYTDSASTLSYGLYMVAVSPGGQPRLTYDGASLGAWGYPGMPEIALSPDGHQLAMSFLSYATGNSAYPSGTVVVIYPGAGSAARIWNTGSAQGFAPGTPSWSSDNRTLILPWLRLDASSGRSRLSGLRMLDTAAPGDSLLSAPLRQFAASPTISTALVTADGRSILASSCWFSGGTVTARVMKLSAADGHQVSVFRTETEKVTLPTPSPGSGAYTSEMVAVSCPVLSADPSGQHVLVDAFTFGRIDNRRFTPLPGAPAGSAESFGAAW
jgi:hypothetical protein